jgi:hypothetical protein
MGLKDRYNAATTAPAESTPERDLAALRAKLASGQTGGVNPPEAKDRMTDDMVAVQPPSVPPTTPSEVSAPAESAPKRGRKRVASSPAEEALARAEEALSTEQIVEMLVARGYAVTLERR